MTIPAAHTVRELCPGYVTYRERSSIPILLMAGGQNRIPSTNQRISVHRRDPTNSPVWLSACDMLPESSEEEEEEEEESITCISSVTYIQQLQRILGHETAEYFLHPPPMELHISPSLQRILDQMEDTPGAEELWRILQEKSKQKLKEDYGEPMSHDKLNLFRNFAQRPVIKKVSRKRHRLIYMRKLLESQQDQTDLLLSSNPFPDMDDNQGIEGPTRFIHQTRESNISYL